MTVKDLMCILEDQPEDRQVCFILEQRHTNLQYTICDAAEKSRGDEDEDDAEEDEDAGPLYLLGDNEKYAPRFDVL